METDQEHALREQLAQSVASYRNLKVLFAKHQGSVHLPRELDDAFLVIWKALMDMHNQAYQQAHHGETSQTRL